MRRNGPRNFSLQINLNLLSFVGNFTFNDKAMMVVAHKPGQSEHKDKAMIQEVDTLAAEAKEKYEKYYLSLLK